MDESTCKIFEQEQRKSHDIYVASTTTNCYELVPGAKQFFQKIHQPPSAKKLGEQHA